MKELEQLKELALESGFSHVGYLDVATLETRVEVRASCAENKCRTYDKRWSCPPGCGTLEECEAKMRQFQRGLILQSTTQLEDAFDVEGMQELGEHHAKYFDTFIKKLRPLYPKAMAMGTGACSLCKECTYPEDPCRFPDQMTSSMEALGLVVSDVCKSNDLPYYYGPGTLTYVGCVLVD